MSGTVSKTSTSKSSKYVYRSTGGAGADVTIEYSTDLTALARLEVLISPSFLVYNCLFHSYFFFIYFSGQNPSYSRGSWNGARTETKGKSSYSIIFIVPIRF